MECNLEYYGNMHQNFDIMEFPDLVFKYDWLVDKKKHEKQEQETGSQQGMMSLNDMMSMAQSGKE